MKCERLMSDRRYWDNWHSQVVHLSHAYSATRCKSELSRAILEI
jgi:hypothetical protein